MEMCLVSRRDIRALLYAPYRAPIEQRSHGSLRNPDRPKVSPVNHAERVDRGVTKRGQRSANGLYPSRPGLRATDLRYNYRALNGHFPA